MDSAAHPHHRVDSTGGFGLAIPATAAAAAQCRQQFTHWIATTGAGTERSSDIVLAVYEAIANAVEHAYLAHTAPNSVEVQAQLSPPGALDVAITDTGTWKREGPSSLRGRGLPLMAALSDTSTVITTAHGTTVALHWHHIRPTRAPDD